MNFKKKIKKVAGTVNQCILALLCTVNGINYNQYLQSVDVMYDCGFGLNDPTFMDMSCLEWYLDKPQRTDSKLFKLKFVSLLLFRIFGKVTKINKEESKYNIKNDKDKLNYRVDNFRGLINACDSLVKSALSNSLDFNKWVLEVGSYITYLTKKVKYEKVINNINEIIHDLISNTRYNLFEGRFYDNGTVTYEILRLAYIMITNDHKYDNFIDGKRFSGLDIDTDLGNQLFKFGNRLNKYIRKNKKNISPMFKSFMEANPIIINNSIYGRNVETYTAFMALEYVKFVINNKELNKFINHILNNKIKFGGKLPKEYQFNFSDLEMMF